MSYYYVINCTTTVDESRPGKPGQGALREGMPKIFGKSFKNTRILVLGVQVQSPLFGELSPSAGRKIDNSSGKFVNKTRIFNE